MNVMVVENKERVKRLHADVDRNLMDGWLKRKATQCITKIRGGMDKGQDYVIRLSKILLDETKMFE